jgi:6-phosphogluconolactonase (cycloisomerase 2 family)
MELISVKIENNDGNIEYLDMEKRNTILFVIDRKGCTIYTYPADNEEYHIGELSVVEAIETSIEILIERARNTVNAREEENNEDKKC